MKTGLFWVAIRSDVDYLFCNVETLLDCFLSIFLNAQVVV